MSSLPYLCLGDAFWHIHGSFFPIRTSHRYSIPKEYSTVFYYSWGDLSIELRKFLIIFLFFLGVFSFFSFFFHASWQHFLPTFAQKAFIFGLFYAFLWFFPTLHAFFVDKLIFLWRLCERSQFWTKMLVCNRKSYAIRMTYGRPFWRAPSILPH